MKYIKFFLAIGAVALFTACSSDDDPVTTDKTIAIDPVITRVSDMSFETGDRIGLSITQSSGTVYQSNLSIDYNGTNFTSATKWYDDETDRSTLIAYYPYTAEGVPSTISVAADQTSTGYAASDFIAAYKENVLPSANAVSMSFKHLLSKAVFYFDDATTSGIASIQIEGLEMEAEINYKTLTVSLPVADNTRASANTRASSAITMQPVDGCYRAIIVPQSADLTLTVTRTNGENLSRTFTATEFPQNGQFVVRGEITDDRITVTESGTMATWDEEGSLTPQTGVTFEEYNGYFIYDDVRYNTVTFANGTTWMAQPLRYIPEGYTVSDDPTTDTNAHIWYPYTTDGTTMTALTDEQSIEEQGYLYDNYVAYNGVEITKDNCNTFEGVQGICPTGWHIPTRVEYFDLVGYSNKNDVLEETAAVSSESALFYDTAYNSSKVTTLNEGGFNFSFTGYMNYDSSAYQKTVLTSSTSSIEEWVGKPAVSFYMTSTAAKINLTSDGDVKSIQNFVLMSAFTKAYTEGRLTLAFSSVLNGTSLRCIKDHNIDYKAKYGDIMNFND